MTAPVFGLLAVLPLGGLFAVRYRRILPGLDRRARRALLVKSAVFLVLAGTGSGSLKAASGSLPLPLAWTLLAIGVGTAWLSRGLREG